MKAHRERSFIYLVDDDDAFRKSLTRLLRVEGFDVESFPSAEDFLALNRYQRPACLVSDIRMPGMSGLELQDMCVHRGIRIPLIFITGHGQVPMSVQAMKKGAVDFLPKPYTREALFQAVNHALKKDRESIQRESALNKVKRRLESLNDREKEILEGIVSGMLNKQIALKLKISEQTVKYHRAHLMIKMKADSIPHLVQLALLKI